MTKRFLLATLIAMAGVLGYAQQTMWVHTGNVHWAYNTETVGTMPYTSANLLTVLEKGFTLADVDSVTVANETFADDNVLVKYAGNTAEVYIAGNIANHITAQVNGARVAVMQDATVASEYTYTLQGTSSSGCFYHEGSYKMTLVLNGVNLVNPDSAAINIQNSKRIAVQLADGTTNTLADGSSNTKKAAFLVKGHAEFAKGGSLTITGNKKHALACNEYMEVKKTVGTITITSSVADAINVAQYFQMNGGTINIQSCGDDGIQVDAEDTANPEEDGHVLIKGGTLTINGSAAGTKCIKAEGNVDIQGGTVTLRHTGNAVWDTDKSKIKEATGIGTDRNLTINGEAAVINITMTGNGTRGMKCDSTMTCTAGNIDINCQGEPWAYGTVDTTKVACAKADYAFILNGATMKCTTIKDEAMGVRSEGTALISDGTLTLNTFDHGIKTDGDMEITGGTINFTVTGAASKAIKPIGNLHITGGTITGTVSGGGETYTDQTTSACAGIKCDGNVIIDGGTFDLKATGAGGKGMNVDGTLTINDGNIKVTTTGSKYGTSSGGGWNPWNPGGGGDSSGETTSSPKGIRAEGNITINGGTFTVSCTGGEGAEGIESKSLMTINGGYIESVCYDDALNSGGDMYIKGGYVYAVATNNDAIDANGNMYLQGGNIFCAGSEEGADANTEGQKKLYIQSGVNLIAYGRSMGALESGAQISQTCYKVNTTYSAGTRYAIYNNGGIAFAVTAPTISGGGGPMLTGGGPGGGPGQNSASFIVSSPGMTTNNGYFKSGVTFSGTSLWSGKGSTNATGGSNASLTTYTSSGSTGPTL